jgi:RND family efflux transporter MFP subunit
MTQAASSLLAAAAMLLTISLAGCSGPGEQAPLPPRPVLYTEADPRTVLIIGPFAGSVEPRFRTQLGFRTFGRLIARDANVGDLVKQGARLAALDPAVQTTQVRSAEAELASAEAQLANASTAEARQRALLAHGDTPPAQAELAAKNREAAAARVVQAGAALTKAKDQLSYTQLLADTDGVITKWDAEIGQVVTTGQAIVTLARPGVKEAVFDMPSDLVASFTTGTEIEIALQLDPSIKTQGRAREIAPEADQATRNRRVKFALSDPPQAFRIGSIVTATLARPVNPVVNLPAPALLEKDGKAFVWVIRTDTKTIDPREVTVSERGADTVTIARGLNKGERVVIAGVHSLTAGQIVRMAELPAAEAKR